MQLGPAVSADFPAPGAPHLAVIHQTAFPVSRIIFQCQAVSFAHTSPRQRRFQTDHAKADFVAVFGAAFVLRRRSVGMNHLKTSLRPTYSLFSLRHRAGQGKAFPVNRTTHVAMGQVVANLAGRKTEIKLDKVRAGTLGTATILEIRGVAGRTQENKTHRSLAVAGNVVLRWILTGLLA